MEQISNKIMGTDGVIFSLAHKNKGGYTQSFLNLLWKNKVVEIEALATPRKKNQSTCHCQNTRTRIDRITRISLHVYTVPPHFKQI